MQFNSGAWPHRLKLLLLYGTISTFLLFFLVSNTLIPSVLDFFNHLVGITQAKMALSEGQFPLRVAPLTHHGWRYPLFQFYSPSSYLFTGLIYSWLTPNSPFLAYKIAIWCALVTGGLYMYRLAFWFVKSVPAAMLAGVIYLTSPYFLITINLTAGLGETIALGLLPAVVYYNLRRFEQPNDYKLLLQASLSWYLLATIHLITFICTSFFVAVWLTLITFKHVKNWKNLIGVGVSFVLGCVLAMWYLAPVLLLGKYFEVNRTFVNNLDFYRHSPLLKDLLSPWIKVASRGNQTDIISLIHPIIGIPTLLAIGISVYIGIKQLRMPANQHKSLKLNKWFFSLLIICFSAFFIAWSPINFWRWLPSSLMVIQHSWRLLGQLAWIGALLSAWAMCWLFANKISARYVALGIAIFSIMTSISTYYANIGYEPFGDVVNDPILKVNPDAYLLDARLHQHLVNAIDSLVLDSLMNMDKPDYLLKLNSSQIIPPALLQMTKEPVIVLQGNLPSNIPAQSFKLNAVINGTPYAARWLASGEFNWRIPISALRDQKDPLALQFEIANNKTLSLPPLPLIASLEGFYKPTQIINAYQMQSNCHQRNAAAVCIIYVPATVLLAELPIYYYPDMLDVSLNGRSIHYFSVVNQSHLLAGIKPERGKINVITFQFRGLVWANIVSGTAWIIFLIVLAYLGIRKVATTSTLLR